MAAVTTGLDGKRVIKPFTWSYSRLKNSEACPKKHYNVDIAKTVKEPESEELLWGNSLHKAAARRLQDGTPLPDGMGPVLEPWIEKFLGVPATILVEQQYAITAKFGPCDWFGKDPQNLPWFRGVCDALKILGPVALAWDWKTGKIVEDSVQLALMAQCIFAHHPAIQKIRTEFIWLKHQAKTTEDFTRADMAGLWRTMWPRIDAMKLMHESGDYPAKPGGLCKRWCPVKKCPHNGE